MEMMTSLRIGANINTIMNIMGYNLNHEPCIGLVMTSYITRHHVILLPAAVAADCDADECISYHHRCNHDDAGYW